MAAEPRLWSMNQFDGTGGWEEFIFDMRNKLTYASMSGKTDVERNSSTMMLACIDQAETLTLDQAKAVTHSGTPDEQAKAKGSNDLLFKVLALNTTGRAKQIVRDTTVARNGILEEHIGGPIFGGPVRPEEHGRTRKMPGNETCDCCLCFSGFVWVLPVLSGFPGAPGQGDRPARWGTQKWGPSPDQGAPAWT